MAEKVDQDVLETFEEVIDQMPLSVPQHVIMNALAAMKEAGRQQGLRVAAEVAHPNDVMAASGSDFAAGYELACEDIRTAITALMEGEGK